MDKPEPEQSNQMSWRPAPALCPPETHSVHNINFQEYAPSMTYSSYRPSWKVADLGTMYKRVRDFSHILIPTLSSTLFLRLYIPATWWMSLLKMLIDVWRRERLVCLEVVLLEPPSNWIVVQDQNVCSTETHFNVLQTGELYFLKFSHKIFSVCLLNNIHENVRCHDK